MDVEDRRFTVEIRDSNGAPDSLAFHLVPEGGSPLPPNGAIVRVPHYTVFAGDVAGNLAFDWSRTPDDPGAGKADMENVVRRRLEVRRAWAGRVMDLVASVERWGQELGWDTRRIEKKLTDAYVGSHRVPALLMQRELVRVLLEPIGRAAPGTEGVVDLYSLPAYDDIAGFYYYGDRWNVHYALTGATAVADKPDGTSLPLSKETLNRVLLGMEAHAA